MCDYHSHAFLLCDVHFIRLKEEKAYFLTETSQYILELLSHAVSIIEKYASDIRSGCVGFNVGLDGMDSISTSFKSFFNSPLFSCQECDSTIYNAIIQSIVRLLKALTNVYEGFLDDINNLQTGWSNNPDISVQESNSLKGAKTTVLDMELDADDDCKDADNISIGETSRASCTSNSKLNIISLISSFFTILPVATWDVLLNLTRIESDHRVI